MSSTAIVDKVTRLVALSASNHPEEARSAAFQACKLIREHKLRIKLPAEDVESSWIEDLKTRRDPSVPLVHISHSGKSSLCSTDLESGVNFFWADAIPTLRGCCLACVKELIGSKRRKP